MHGIQSAKYLAQRILRNVTETNKNTIKQVENILNTTYVLRRRVLEIHVTVKWGSTLLRSFIVYDDKPRC